MKGIQRTEYKLKPYGYIDRRNFLLQYIHQIEFTNFNSEKET